MEGDNDSIDITHYFALVVGLSDYSNMEDKGFASMPAAKTDLREFEKHLRNNTYFRTTIKTLLNFSRNEFDDAWEQIQEEIMEIRSEDKSARICFKFYYSGHGCTFAGSNMLTHMVCISDGDGYIPIEEKLRKLSRKSNLSVSAILDCCRNEIEAKARASMEKPDFG
jgi:hypothetical protein